MKGHRCDCGKLTFHVRHQRKSKPDDCTCIDVEERLGTGHNQKKPRISTADV